jgi:hypothetical protein
MRNIGKVYLGDAVYCDWDGYYLILTTENDSSGPSNVIYIEPTVFANLLKYRDGLSEVEECDSAQS